MAGQPNRRDQSKRQENQRKYAQLKAMRDKWVQQGLVQHGIAPEDALQRIIDDSMFRYLEECERNDAIRAAGGKVSDRRERALSREAATIAQMALQYHLEDRRVTADEKRIELYGYALQLVAARFFGMTAEEYKQLPKMLKEVIVEIQATPEGERRTLVHRAHGQAEIIEG